MAGGGLYLFEHKMCWFFTSAPEKRERRNERERETVAILRPYLLCYRGITTPVGQGRNAAALTAIGIVLLRADRTKVSEWRSREIAGEKEGQQGSHLDDTHPASLFFRTTDMNSNLFVEKKKSRGNVK